MYMEIYTNVYMYTHILYSMYINVLECDSRYQNFYSLLGISSYDNKCYPLSASWMPRKIVGVILIIIEKMV